MEISKSYSYSKVLLSEDMIISLHIPKTAGTSFRFALRQEYGHRLLEDTSYLPGIHDVELHKFLQKYRFEKASPYLNLGFLIGDRRYVTLRRIYRGTARTFYFSAKRWMLRRDIRQIEAKFSILHGHFPLRKYFGLMPDATLCTFFREPLSHFHSLYHHLSRHPWHDKNSSANDPSYLIHEKKYSFMKFSQSSYARTLFKSYLNQVPIERFSFIGLTEEYELSLRLYNAIFGTNLSVFHENKNPKNDMASDRFSREDQEKLLRHLRKQQQLYDKARGRFDVLCKKYL